MSEIDWVKGGHNAAVYRSISFSVRCPEIAAISLADDPLSAKRRIIALRRPCATQRVGRPANATAFFITRVRVARLMGRPLGVADQCVAFCGCGLDRGNERRMQWDGKFGVSLLLNNPDHSVKEIRSAHFDNVTCALMTMRKPPDAQPCLNQPPPKTSVQTEACCRTKLSCW